LIYFPPLYKSIFNLLKKVFERLRKSNFKLQLDKCEFMKRKTEFVGHIISTEGIRANPNKM